MDDKQRQPYNGINLQNSDTTTRIAPSQQVQDVAPTQVDQKNPIFSPTTQPVTNLLMQPKSKNHLRVIIMSALVIVIFILVGFITYNTFFGKTLSPKTIAQFEQIMKDNGYKKAGAEGAYYSDSQGGYVTYFKQDETAADGVAMFYDVKSKEVLKDLVNEFVIEKNRDSKALFENFDWSKEYNKNEVCSKNNAQVYICMDVVHVENTLLSVLYHSNSEDKVHSEINKVISTMGYAKD